jgi:sugar O-acyltransferase (sialic acid O-acetyltransferase NeuD family)
MSSTAAVVVGAGRHGREVMAYLRRVVQTSGIEILGFVDDKAPTGELAGSKVLGGLDCLPDLAKENGSLNYITAVGANGARRQLVERIESLSLAGLDAYSVVDPSATMGERVTIGSGTCVAMGAIVTIDVEIGKHCIVNVNASISHDVRVGDWCNVNPGAIVCGDVTLGEGCFVGAGAVIRDKVAIGPWTTIGAGAVVVSDLPGGCLAVGLPARVVKDS